MKYALESLPDLLSDQDFRDLCVALGIPEGEKGTGRDVARLVRNQVLIAHDQSAKNREQLRQRGLA